jgi:hypothetical protein
MFRRRSFPWIRAMVDNSAVSERPKSAVMRFATYAELFGSMIFHFP